jgi:beta-glucosidase
MCDIARDPRWGRVMEGAGEDPYLGSRIAEARVHGFQGKGPGNTDAVMACVKHYAGYGAAIAGRDYNNVDMGERYFREFYLPPYKAAVAAGAMTVMTSFNDYDGVPATGNKFLLTDVLRNEWGFKGFVVTDYTSINEMVNHGVAANDKGAGELAANAGVDMDMQGAVYQRFLAQSIKEGVVSISTVDDAVRRILKIKYDMGLFENPYKYCDEAREKKTLMSADNLNAARDVARKSIVLLKNQGDVLPLTAAAKKIVLVGPLADNKSELMGSWSGAGNSNDCISLAEGIKARKGVQVSVFKGFDFKGAMLPDFAAAIEAVKTADVVIIAGGESADMTGEASSRAEIGLPGVQEDIISSILAIGKPAVLVLMNGRPLAIPKLVEKAPAILEAWWLGTEAGPAIADVLFGDYNPSAKLTMSFPRSVGQVPVFYNQKSTGRPFDPNSKWTSKYLDMPNSPQFPFGYGLSYTTFSYSEPKIDKTVFKPGEPVHISVTVTNSGKRDGEEIVQLYVRDLVGSVTRPVKELKGFRKIMIPKGGSKEIVFTLTDQDLRFYRKDMQFASEPGEFEFMIGRNSEDVKSVKARLTEK